MEQVLCLLFSDLSWASPITGLTFWDWCSGLALIAVFILGSALWQASARMRQDNDRFEPLNQFAYTWQRDALLMTYLTLLVLLIGVVVFIAWSPVTKMAFWFGYAAVVVGQQIPMGQRISQHLVRLIESAFRPQRQIIPERTEELVK